MTSRDPTPPHYQHRVGGVLLDPYRIAAVYGLDNHALFSALKKVLAAGKRGAKDKAKDVQDAIDALVRWQEMEAEDSADAIAFGGGRASGKTEAQRQRTLAIAEDYAPDPVTAALDAVDSHDPRECAARIAELERELAAVKVNASTWESYYLTADRRMAMMERERDEAREDAAKAKRVYNDLFDGAGKEIRALKQALTAEREAHEATRRELAESQKRLESEVLQHTDTLQEGTELRAKLAEYEERYRPRRQSEEPAPVGSVLKWGAWSENWELTHWRDINDGDTWTHQPPAPGEGE